MHCQATCGQHNNCRTLHDCLQCRGFLCSRWGMYMSHIHQRCCCHWQSTFQTDRPCSFLKCWISYQRMCLLGILYTACSCQESVPGGSSCIFSRFALCILIPLRVPLPYCLHRCKSIYSEHTTWLQMPCWGSFPVGTAHKKTCSVHSIDRLGTKHTVHLKGDSQLGNWYTPEAFLGGKSVDL